MEKGQQPDFDSIKRENVYGIGYWSARDLMPLLGYGHKWQNFEAAVKRAMSACEETGNSIQNHFTDASKMVVLGSGSERKVKDYHLSRLACYLIAMNGDPRKPEIAAVISTISRARNFRPSISRTHRPKGNCVLSLLPVWMKHRRCIILLAIRCARPLRRLRGRCRKICPRQSLSARWLRNGGVSRKGSQSVLKQMGRKRYFNSLSLQRGS
jgi:hypothetical protein